MKDQLRIDADPHYDIIKISFEIFQTALKKDKVFKKQHIEKGQKKKQLTIFDMFKYKLKFLFNNVIK